MKKLNVVLLLNLALIFGLDFQIKSQSPGDSSVIVCPVNAAFTRYSSNNNINSVSTIQSAFSPSAIISCGNFRVYYEDLQQNTGEGFNDPIVGAARRNTICAALSYLQSVLNITVTIDLHIELSLTPNFNPASSTAINWAAVAGPIYKPGTYGSIPGYFGGNLYDHVMTGIDPDINDYDAHITFNFHQVWSQSNPPYPSPLYYWDDYQITTPSCKVDLFSIALHESTHCLGFLSGLGDDGTANHRLTNLSNTSNIGSFTKLDEYFLYYGDPRNPATFGGNKLVTGTTNPAINLNFASTNNFLTNFTPTTTASVWMTANGAPNNYKSYDGYWYRNYTSGSSNWQITIGSMLSHLDRAYVAVYRAGQYSPGFQPKYVMGHSTAANELIRNWSLQEIRILLTLGYNLNPTFSSSTSLSSGAVSNASLLNTNSPPIRSNYATVDLVKFPLTSYTDFGNSFAYPETKPATYTITNTNIPGNTPVPLLTIDTHTLANTSDVNGDPIGIYPNSFYGIKGVTTGGNNHNNITLTNSNTIVYTPPPGFYGRAEFGFNLWDGKEKGAAIVITIEVLHGTFTITPGNELLINGSFEDATEVKTASNPTAAIASRINNQITELNYGTHQSGGHPYIAFSYFGNDDFSGLTRKESYRYCWLAPNTTPPPIYPDGYGWPSLSCDQFPLYPAVNSAAMPVNNNQNNECYAAVAYDQGEFSPLVSTLMNPLQPCKYYRLEFDATQTSQTYSMGSVMNCSLLAVNNLTYTNQLFYYPYLTYGTLQSIPIDYTVSALTVNSTNYAWQHVIKDFFYCSAPTSTVLIKAGVGVNFGIDNISLKENVTPPPPLIVTATNSSTLFCVGSPAILTGHAINSSCATTFTWLPMNVVSSTVLVVPPNLNTTYTLLASDGCRTGSAIVSPAALPVGTFTVPPICIGQLSPPLEPFLPPGTPTPGNFTGPAVVYSLSLYHFIDLTPSSPAFTTIVAGVQNYTYTYYLPNNCSANYTFNVTFLATPTIAANPPCIFSGQSATLTGVPSSGSYTWQPGNIVTSSIVVTPTTTTAYDFLYGTAVCSGQTPKFSVNVMIPVTFTNLPTSPLCTYQNINYLENYLVSNVPLSGTWTASGGIGLVTSTLGTSAVLSPTLSAGIYTIGYSYLLSATTCSTGNQFTIAVSPGFSLTTSGPATHCGNLNTPTVVTATSTTSGLTYTWFPGSVSGSTQSINPMVPTTYTVVANNGICSLSSTIAVQGTSTCCRAPAYVLTSTMSSGTIGGSGGTYGINQNITVTGLVYLSGTFLMAPNVGITVASGGTLITSSGGAHLSSCFNMWSGILVKDGARVEFKTGSDLIEDAFSGITSDGSTNNSSVPASFNIDINDVVFNRNLVGITISNFTVGATLPPFSIYGCVFTCRSFTNASASWPNAATLRTTSTPTNALGTPYAFTGFPPVSVTAPNAFQQPFGILVQNSGLTVNPNLTTPYYYSVIIGAPMGTLNLFDNMFYGIYAVNSNVACYYNVFQNSRCQNANPIAQGAGISAVNLNTNPLNYNTILDMVPPVNASTNNNKFYDCQIGVNAQNIFNLNIQYAEFKSTQSSSTTFSVSNPGNFGIKLISNRFKIYTISNNSFLNVRNGLYFATDYSQLHIPGTALTGLYWGNTLIQNNLFCAALTPTTTVVNEFMDNGIVAENLITNSANGNLSQTATSFLISNNNFSKVRRGVRVSNFFNIPAMNTASNTIGLAQDVTTTNSQWCIKYENDNMAQIRYNTLTGFSTSTASPVAGLYSTMSQNGTVQCNSVNSLCQGYQFAGGNNATTWRNNTLQLTGLGLMLSNYGFISPQGNSVTPSDNKWIGSTWTGGASKSTYVDATSLAYNNAMPNPLTNPGNSLLWVRNTTGGYIPQSQGGNPTQSYTVANAIKLVSNNASLFNCSTGLWTASVSPGNPWNHRTFNEAIVNDSLGYSDPSTSEINKTNLFRLIDTDTTIIDSSLILFNFYHAQNLGNKGKLLAIEKAISSSCHYITIGGLVQSITPNTAIETNYRDFYNLLVAYKRYDTLTALQDSSLSTLARKCPFTDGAVIYQARSLFNIVNNAVVNFEDNCGEGNPGGRQAHFNNDDQNAKINSKKEEANYSLFPNPAIDELHIFSTAENEEVNFIITDVSSKQLVNKTITIDNYHTEVKLNLLNGVYFVILINKDSERIVRKLIIAK